ncbi:phage head spike fiber domain-containing protein [Sphingobium cupriresistens]|uniref:Tip attachment protein J domain-containing protein n=1 Tax=Sphingobium cupriresistens LL01 TaxID=1420583 RepID=A0A0J7Y045_9SPHN|nr:hypothetical protein [Sphingobium cupriresistens]KMS57142.1 hypothetical protein V473_02565 [Sphingobium cupriresistens LL01]
MGKALRIAAVVVAIAAAIPTGGTSLLASGIASAGIAAGATASAIASGLAVGLGFAASMTAKKPKVSGVQTSWSADPDAAIPIIFGRTLMSGDIRYRKQHGNKNKWDTLVSVLSGCGPIHAINQTYMEKEPISFSGGLTGVHQIDGHDRIWQRVQLGACPEASYLAPLVGAPPGWTPAHKLSGYAAVLNTFEYDASGDHTLTSTPRFNWLGQGVLCYDPRLDSSYPGGSGACRWNDPATWVYSECGWIQALTFAIGWHQGPSNTRVGGVGMDISAIDVAAFVEAANIADANAWKSGGRVTTADDKWEVMKSLAQAGGGEPIRYGAILSCFVNAPRVSIGTIGIEDVIGQASVATAQSIRNRINSITPRYTSEDHFWEQVPAGTVINADYRATDGRERTKMVAYPMVQCAASETPDQVAQLAGYDIANAREAGPIVLPLKLRFLGYRGGDCLTIEDDPAFGRIAGKDVIVLKRQIDPTSATVTLTLRTETASKHPWALGQVGVPAPMTDSTSPPPFSMEQPTLLTLVTTTDTTATISARAQTTGLFQYMVFFAGNTATFADAVPITPQIVDAPGAVRQVQEIDIVAGPRFYWAVAYTADGIGSDPTGPLEVNVGGLEFGSASLPSGASLTRASTKSRINSSGALQSVAVDAAAIEYHPTTHAVLGVSVEPSATNEATNNSNTGAAVGIIGSGGALPTGWTMPEGNGGAAVEVKSITTVDGFDIIEIQMSGTATSTAALTLRPDTAGAAASAGQTWTNSLYLALSAGSLTNVSGFALRAGSETGSTSLSGITSTLTRYINTRTLTSTSARQVVRFNWSAVGAAINFTLKIALPQRELGSKATSPIKTSGAVATRAADALTLSWASRNVPDGAIMVRYTFDDGSTQDVPTTVSGGNSVVPTNLNRPIIRKVERV